MLLVYQPALLASLLRSQRNLDHIIRLNFFMSSTHLSITSLISIATIIPLVMPQDPLNPVVGTVSIAVFFNVTALAMLFLGVQGAYINGKVQAILELAYALNHESKTKRVMENIAVNQKQIRNTGIIQFIIYGIFG